MLNLLIIDDHQLFTYSLETILSNNKLFGTIVSVDNFQAAKFELDNLNFDIILLDINLGDENGIDFINTIKKMSPNCKIIIVSSNNDLFSISNSYKSGADGFVNKSSDFSILLNAINKVIDGKKFFNGYEKLLPSTNKKTVIDQEYQTTPRELEILKLFSMGLDNSDVAKKLSISVRTVETHRKNLFRKFDVNTILALIKIAKTNSLI